MVNGLSRILLRVALAVPMLYGAWSLRPAWHLTLFAAVVTYLAAVGLLLGCALVVASWKARWAWGIVAASGLWFTFLFTYPFSQVTDIHGHNYLLRHLPAEVAIGVYVFILALAFIVARRPDPKGDVLTAER